MSELEPRLRALRALHDGRSDDAARTRARVLLLASSQRKRRRVYALVVAPLAAALVVSMAWAATSGRVTGWLDRVAAVVRADRSAQPSATPPGLSSATPSALPSAPSALSSAPSALPSAPSVLSSAPSALSPSASDSAPLVEVDAADAGPPLVSRPAPPRAPARDAGTSEEDALYLRAHQAHFVAHDSAGALRAWDEYLRAYPNGRFALEARYNRGLALVRLGRYAEGRAALEPFAAGRYGGYRQSEARALLDAMDAGQ